MIQQPINLVDYESYRAINTKWSVVLTLKRVLTLLLVNVTLTASLGSAEIDSCIGHSLLCNHSSNNGSFRNRGRSPPTIWTFSFLETCCADLPVDTCFHLLYPGDDHALRYLMFWALVVMGEVHGDGTFAGSTPRTPFGEPTSIESNAAERIVLMCASALFTGLSA